MNRSGKEKSGSSRFKGRSMYVELAVAISGIAVLFSIVVINLNLRHTEHLLINERNHYVKAVADVLAASAATAWETKNYQALYDVARYAAIQPDVRYFQFLDNEGLVLASAGKGRVGEKADDALAAEAMKSPSHLLQTFLEPQTGADMLDVSAPVRVGNKRVGTIRVGFDISRYKATLREMKARAAGLSFAVILLALCVAFALARRNLRPLRTLKNRLDELLAGKKIEKVKVSAVREIEELARSVNAVTHRWSEIYNDLEEAYAELKSLDAMKDKFVSLVSHELRTPLSSIMAYSEILSKPEDLNEERLREFASIINTESKRLNRLINDVLDLTRMKGGRLVYHYAEEDVNRAVEQAVRTCGGDARSKEIELTFQPDRSIKKMKIDFDRIVQVATNLINNALKFTPKGGKVTVRTEARGDKGVMLSVSDTGSGIPPEDLERIFDEFEQVGNGSMFRGGTGLGLSIAKRLVEDGHGGKIWAESEGEGKGSTFFVFLPYRRSVKDG